MVRYRVPDGAEIVVSLFGMLHVRYFFCDSLCFSDTKSKKYTPFFIPFLNNNHLHLNTTLKTVFLHSVVPNVFKQHWFVDI